MTFHPDVLAVHAQFGGDLESMQALYDRPGHLATIERLSAELARARAERNRAALVAADEANRADALSAKLEAVKAERDELKEADGNFWQAIARAEAAESELARLSAKLARAREALIWISDRDWGWRGGGSDQRLRGIFGRCAAECLNVPTALPPGWPDPKNSETRAAMKFMEETTLTEKEPQK